MKVEREIKISHPVDVVLQIFADPSFTIPRIFPNVNRIKVDGEKFEAEGKVALSSYHSTGRVFLGYNEVKYVYDSDRGGGVLKISKVNENMIRITLEYDGSLLARIESIIVNSNLNKLEKNINEEIRLERIKRKI
ncbi:MULTISPECIES: STK_08120 family protein [unclassified Stygiolobus]|uniref:STK_08120 family protein n=1 Tax=unclassified Stygiolobus TaxID=2824672 RepID=UPI00307E15E8